MSLMRPLSNQEMHDLRSRMNRVFDDQNGASGGTGEDSQHRFAPAVDVAETEHDIILQAEVPGMKKDEIDIQLTGDRLTLRGERKLEPAARGEHFHRIERQYGQWQRNFQIEVPVDTAKVSADYELGVLTVRLPKQEAVKPRQIKIQTQS